MEKLTSALYIYRFTKNLPDPDAAPNFNYSLLQSLLECLPAIPAATSAGAIHWFFALLNRVKCMDICLTGQKCVELLTQVARQYSTHTNHWHSLLKARWVLMCCASWDLSSGSSARISLV